MDLVQGFIEKAKAAPKRIVYPEGSDERIVAAACKARDLGIAEPILLGAKDAVEQAASSQGLNLDGITVIAPKESAEDIATFAKIYSESRGLKETIAAKLVRKPLSFGGMMVRTGAADGMVAGVASATSSVIQAASLCIGFQEGLSTPSSFFIMIIPEFEGKKDVPLLFADCAVNIQPDARQLAEIGIASGTNARGLLGLEPEVVFLSFSTKGSASHEDVDKVIEATKIAQDMNPGFAIDGELQADAAIISSVGAKKAPDSPVAGKANVLVFPDLDSGNMCYKLVQRLAGAAAVGPILQGFAKPVNDMSRGATVEDLVAVTAITAVQAQGA